MVGLLGGSVDRGFGTQDVPAGRKVREPSAGAVHPGCVHDRLITDTELVLLARAGEADALGVLLERHRVPLYAAAVAVLGDRDAANDAVQEAFVVALTRLDSLRDPGAVGGWLQMVVRNCCLMELRRGRRQIPSDQLEVQTRAPGPEELVDQHMLRSWVWTALEAIGEDERLTLLLRYFTRCHSYQAIAAVTGVPVGTVRSRLNRARRRLLAALTAGAGPPRHQAQLEAARSGEWASFYRQLHERPEARTYGGLYRHDVIVQDGTGCWRGIQDWSAEERTAIDLGVRAQVVGLAATTDLTVLDINFQNPPCAAGHCPPSSTFVHHLRGGRSASVDIYYHAS
jgi:RNA polymerase sigma-70 factor (ECF subfamily)